MARLMVTVIGVVITVGLMILASRAIQMERHRLAHEAKLPQGWKVTGNHHNPTQPGAGMSGVVHEGVSYILEERKAGLGACYILLTKTTSPPTPVAVACR